MHDALSIFHPLVAGWFADRLGEPTDIQVRAWREISKGLHVLATAPTGSGKTLAAFLWAVNKLVTGEWKGGTTAVLYVSPLKALNNDIRRNLTGPLGELRQYFTGTGEAFPDIRAATRSGDTAPEDRRRLYRHPPEILITTPESLNIMLTSGSGRALFRGIRTVILDEIHAIAGTKRGTHLITAVERLTLLAGEFQRIALSATLRPMEPVADFIGGYEMIRPHPAPVYRKRGVALVRSEDEKRYAVSVECPDLEPGGDEEDAWWRSLAGGLKRTIMNNRSTLIFANSRRTAEKIARFLNEGEEEIIAYSHHGSIAREIRLEVEERMKRGELRAIVATSSLELGIDIGELDEVVLVQTPFSISSALQRIGRAGHGVGETSRGRLYPFGGMDFLEAAVMAHSVEEGDIEPIRPVECPLDVLAQVIVSMVSAREWGIDELHSFIKTCHPYRNLSLSQYRLVLEMLAGRYAEGRLKELSPRVSIDKIENTVAARPGASYLIYTSGGTIPDRGYYSLRVQETGAKIGELDEEFVWERRIGDAFTLGTQVWRIRRITHNDVEVAPLPSPAGMVPFWRAEAVDRDFHYSERILSFLKDADADLSDPDGFARTLRERYSMSGSAAGVLVDFLQRQKSSAGGALPHRRRIVIECYTGAGGAGGRETVLHTFWGGRLNRPFAMALSAAWEERHGAPLEVFTSDANVLLMLPESFPAIDAVRMVTPENLEELLRKRLESSGFFGARFRENAARALLLPRAGLRKRYPLWMNRLRAKKLMETVARYPDFPIILETWRECFQDSFDLENLKNVLGELASGEIEIVEAASEAPSPFCGNMIWRRTNTFMYEDDTPAGRVSSGLDRTILDEVLRTSSLRPRIPLRLVGELESRLQRVKPGYAPSGPGDLLDWLKERLLIPEKEWEELLASCRRDSHDFPERMPEPWAGKIAFVRLEGGRVRHAAALENMPLVSRLFHVEDTEAAEIRTPYRQRPGEEGMDLPGFLLQWLSYYGPVTRERIEEWGIPAGALDSLLEDLAGQGLVIVDAITENAASAEVCHADNLERLLRMARLERRPSFKALPADFLPLFLASWQGIVNPGDTLEELQARLEKLFGHAASAFLWEEEILPARMRSYQTTRLDGLMNSTPLTWYGAGRGAVAFGLEAELGIFIEPRAREIERARGLFPDPAGRYGLFEIARHVNLRVEEAAAVLWDLAWRSAVANDSMETLRKGILNDFEPKGFDIEKKRARLGTRRSGIGRWSASRPLQGAWRILDAPVELDRIDRRELDKERCRVLFDRYGVLFREIVLRETASFQWRRMFPVLRLMELSGEIMSGYFFDGVPGVQFITPEALRFLREGLDEEAVWWINAKDPASFCGSGLDALRGGLPRRHESTHLVFEGRRVVLESYRNGNDVRFHIPPDHPRFHESLRLFTILVSRDFNPLNKVFVEKINGANARSSVYFGAMREFGFRSAYKGLDLRKRY
jgi:ATP-dependent Lhr-like helicase